MSMSGVQEASSSSSGPQPNTFFPRPSSFYHSIVTALAQRIQNEVILQGCVPQLYTRGCHPPCAPPLQTQNLSFVPGFVLCLLRVALHASE